LAKSVAHINPDIVSWAMDREQASSKILASRMNVSEDKVHCWVQGDKKPTFKQAQKLAAVLNVPFGYLFLARPPREEFPLPDLRTIGDVEPVRLDSNSKDVILDVIYKHEWYVDALRVEGDEIKPFVGRFKPDVDPSIVANDMRVALGVDQIYPGRKLNYDQYLRELMRAAETIGIWTIRTGIVRNNTHRPLSVDQFRGFAIADSYAPLVFINGQDARAAQIFTFAHEVAHIWVGASGVSNAPLKPVEGLLNIEKFCNKVAAEFLVPEDLFAHLWSKRITLEENCERLSNHFRVSTAVCARRALELGLVARDEFERYFAILVRLWQRVPGDKGGNFHNALPIRNGENFYKFVVSSAGSGNLLLRDAGRLLNVNPSYIAQRTIRN
jgi:Zn-dependent peptidase ImmA (M78 family)